ncbi:MAG TPA: SDR family oxidoreductase [Actinomycetota bacterium]|nr:SDR family oxidoreductase [Actinomycetota bacterium]
MSELLDNRARTWQGPLAGRVAIVTGGGRGLGEAICRCLAEAGASVVACDIRSESAQAVAESIRAGGGEARALGLDVTDGDQAGAAVDEALGAYGGLDILVNNAGIDATLPFDEMPAETFDRILDVNLRGPVVMARAVFPHLRQQGAGHIVNVASTAAKRTWPNASAYHASKWGLVGFSHALHTEARPLGIKVTAIVAGGMRTPFLFDRFPDLDPGVLQDPASVAETIRFVLTQPDGTVIPEVTVLPMRETSWP